MTSITMVWYEAAILGLVVFYVGYAMARNS
ncbi:hypothetical protein At1D132_12800 [Agrobacterium fabrum]|nr:hypothetical protein At1D132_12800 [Agrobacterium fabrum]